MQALVTCILHVQLCYSRLVVQAIVHKEKMDRNLLKVYSLICAMVAQVWDNVDVQVVVFHVYMHVIGHAQSFARFYGTFSNMRLGAFS